MSSDGEPEDQKDNERRDKADSKYSKPKQPKINKQHPEFELTYDMMLGIRTVVGKTEAQAHGSLTPADFQATIKLKFPGRGSAITPAHQMRDFKFKDYCPEVFRMIREKFHINPADYLMCVCGNFQYLEFISNSKSGQFFFYTHDRKYMIKTVSQGEGKFLRKILPAYYAHIAQNPQTLLTRFYGLHRVRPSKKKERHFLIMGSVFYTSKYIHKVFDLKGSTQGRAATEQEKKSSACIFKDLDLLEQNIELKIGQPRADILNAQLARDVEFLRRLNIMDYSLLLGIHYRNRGGKHDRPNTNNESPEKGNQNGTDESALEMNEIHLDSGASSPVAANGELKELETPAKEKFDRELFSVAEKKSPTSDSNIDPYPSRTTRAFTALLPASSSSPSQFFHRPTSMVPQEFSSPVNLSFLNTNNESPTLQPNGEPINSNSMPEPLQLQISLEAGSACSISAANESALALPATNSVSTPSSPQTNPLPFPFDSSVQDRNSLNGQTHHGSLSPGADGSDSSQPRSPRVTRSNTVIDIPTFERSPTSGKLIKRQSQYGLPKHWNVTSKPSDISFNAPEFEPLVIQTPRQRIERGPTPELALLVKEEEKLNPISIDKLIVDGQLVFDAGGLAGLTEAGQLSNEIYFMGIIDILTIYGMKKRMETIAKAIKYDTSEISAVNPKAYGERFKKFLAMAIK